MTLVHVVCDWSLTRGCTPGHPRPATIKGVPSLLPFLSNSPLFSFLFYICHYSIQNPTRIHPNIKKHSTEVFRAPLPLTWDQPLFLLTLPPSNLTIAVSAYLHQHLEDSPCNLSIGAFQLWKKCNISLRDLSLYLTGLHYHAQALGALHQQLSSRP